MSKHTSLREAAEEEVRNGQKRQLLRRSAAYIIQVAGKVFNIGFNSRVFRMAACTVSPLHRTVSGSSMDLDLH